MPMTIAITRNTPARFSGFLCSCMHEIAPGVYVAPRMKKSVRERVWKVMLGWEELIPNEGGIVLFWQSKKAPSGLAVRLLGWPKKDLVEYEGIWFTHRSLTEMHDTEELNRLLQMEEPEIDEDDPKLPKM